MCQHEREKWQEKTAALEAAKQEEKTRENAHSIIKETPNAAALRGKVSVEKTGPYLSQQARV